MTTPAHCPFCFPAEDRIAFEDRLTRGLWDASPVSKGHLLIVPRRHVPTWFDATAEERAALTAGIDRGRELSAASEVLPKLLVVELEGPAQAADVHIRQLGLGSVVQRQRVAVALPIVHDDMASLGGPLGHSHTELRESRPKFRVPSGHEKQAASGSPARRGPTGRRWETPPHDDADRRAP
jgi:hypothetical protein